MGFHRIRGKGKETSARRRNIWFTLSEFRFFERCPCVAGGYDCRWLMSFRSPRPVQAVNILPNLGFGEFVAAIIHLFRPARRMLAVWPPRERCPDPRGFSRTQTPGRNSWPRESQQHVRPHEAATPVSLAHVFGNIIMNYCVPVFPGNRCQAHV